MTWVVAVPSPNCLDVIDSGTVTGYTPVVILYLLILSGRDLNWCTDFVHLLFGFEMVY